MAQARVATLPLRVTHKPATPDTMPSGFCKHWDNVFIKANGRVPCGCDTGEPFTLGRVNLDELDFVTDILNSKMMREMRVCTMVQLKGFIDECAKCAFFKPLDLNASTDGRNPHYKELSRRDRRAGDALVRVQMRRGWPIGSIDWIDGLHIESSLPCTLRCPACMQTYDPHLLRNEGPPYFFSLKMMEAITRSLDKHDVPVRRIGFGGRGEPTLNPQLGDLIARCRAACPNAVIEMDTNSQHRFKDEYLMLDAMYCSIDGSRREAYETYRIGGNFESAIDFMRTAATRKKAIGARCAVNWKYILFDTTESIELLDEAQRLAKAIDVDELIFIITWTAGSNGKVFPPKHMTKVETVEAYLRAHPIFNRARVLYM
jgi:ferredoxin